MLIADAQTPTWIAQFAQLLWPTTVLLALVMFRTSIRDLMARLGKLTAFGTSLEAVQPQEQNKDAFSAISPSATVLAQAPTAASDELSEVESRIDRILALYSPETNKLFNAWIESETKISSVSDPLAAKDRLLKYSRALFGTLQFEKIYSLIFGSQIAAVEAANAGVLTIELLRKYYDDAVEQYPKFYAAYGYPEWTTFLSKWANVLLINDQTVQITDLGRDFLLYLSVAGKSTKKAY
jgi:hypothetical protein